MKFFNNISDVYATEAQFDDRGDVVQTVLLIAGFAIVTLLVVNWIGTAIMNKGADTAECIEGANTYNTSGSSDKCKNADHSKNHSFKKDSGYRGRYGGR